MKLAIIIFVLSVGAWDARAQSTSNNTSACSANGVPTVGCNGVGSMPFLTNPGNTGAQTTTVDPLPTQVSTVSIKSLLYSGSTTRIMAEYQPWFCNTSNPCNGHQVNGMEESTAAQVLEQAEWMKTLGVDVTDVDYYGCAGSCGQPSTQNYNLSVTTALASAISANPSITPKFMIMIDEGAIDATGIGQCPPASGDQSACLISAINLQVDYLESNWLTQTYYEKNATDSHPIVLYFINQGNWPDTDFDTVYGAVAAHATSGNSCGGSCTYAATVDFVDEDAGAFSETGIAGGYAWPQPNNWNSTDQYCWYGEPCSFNYLADFYSHARDDLSKIAMGGLYKGFDDSNASWGSDRVIAQQCGQVLGFTAAAISTAGYSSSSQLQYAQIATWNDYEEATEVETGINNCLSVGTPLIFGGNISWTVLKSDPVYGSLDTLNSISIYTGTSTPTTLYVSGLSPSATTHTAPTLTVGQHAWIYLVGGPLIQNSLSAPTSTAYGVTRHRGFVN
jgi:hypothetical protein